MPDAIMPKHIVKMKNKLFKLFKILVSVVLVAKFTSLIFHFDERTNDLLNAVMFSLIGVAYLVVGFAWNSLWAKIVIITCGLFLIAMNFFNGHELLYIPGIVCILLPVFIARLDRQNSVETNPSKADEIV